MIADEDGADMFGEESDEEENNVLATERPEASGVMAFHNGTEESLLCHVKRTATEGDCMSILRQIDH